MTTPVLYEQDGAIGFLRLNRPDSLNAINVPLLRGLVAALARGREATVVVLEGEGRAFCVGEDLKQTLAPERGDIDELRESFELLQETTRLMTGAPTVFIASVQGYAIGGGAELALAADLVVCGRATRFRFPEVTLGHAVTGGISARLPALVGLIRAKDLLLRSPWIDADQALTYGLVNEVVEDPAQRARQLAAELASVPRRSLAATKRGLERAALPHQEEVLAGEVDAASFCFAAEEAAASIDAFREAHR